MTQGHLLKAFREKHSPPLSQADLARLLEVSRSHVLRLESGTRQAGRKLLPVIKKKIGIRPEVMRPDLVLDGGDE